MSAKFDEDVNNSLAAIVFTRIRRDARTDWRTHARTDGTMAALLYPLRNALRGDNKKRLLLSCKHHFKSDLINNMDHMRISGNEPPSVILSQTK